MKKWLLITLAALALSAILIGSRYAIRSPLFVIQVVEVEGSGDAAGETEAPPVDAETITQLAAIPVGAQNLFDLDLKQVEARVLAHEWVRAVRLQKHFPQTVTITPIFRQPRAIVQTDDAGLRYVDADGKIFGKITLADRRDLPVISGFSDSRQVVDALGVLDEWSKSAVGQISQVASLAYEAERGYRALITYPIAAGVRGRTLVDLGHELGPDLDPQLGRLNQVLHYLITNRLAVRQIWADAGKKVVVKFTRGS